MQIGQRELQILRALWDEGGEASVTGVLERLRDGGAELAYTTVQTLLNRMVDKNVAARKKRGRAFVYVPRLTVEAVSRERVDETIASHFGGSARALAVHLVEHELDEEELASLERLIASRRNAQRGAGDDDLG